MNDYTNADLMAAILDVRDAAAHNHANLDRFEVKLDAKIDSRIDGLRHDMNRRFDRIDQRFDDVYARFEDVDARFDRMDARFDRMDERFDRLEDRVAAIEPHGHRPAS